MGLAVPDQPADRSTDRSAGPPTLALFVAVLCSLLRQAGRLGWLDRSVVEGVRALTRLAVELQAAGGGFTLVAELDGFRHAEQGESLASQGRAVVQLLRLFQRRGWSGAVFAPSVQPLDVKNLLQGLLDPRFDAAAALRRTGGITLARAAAAEAPPIVILRDGHEQPLSDLPEAPAPGAGPAPAARQRAGQPADPLAGQAGAAGASAARAGSGGRAGGGNAPTGTRPAAPAGAAASGGGGGAGGAAGTGAGPAARAAGPSPGPAVVARPERPAHGGEPGGIDAQLQELRCENAAIRDAVANLVTTPAGAPAAEPAVTICLDAMERDEHLQYLLVSLRQHDRYTFDHSCNVALIAVAVARSMGFKGEDLRRFATAALLHDIGKLYTPLSVLNKPGKFTPEEWKAMRRHPQDGMEILDGAGHENEYSERVTLLHHVGFDGNGYPGNARSEPDIFAHLVQVADIYDAFTSIRPYRQQARPREVLEVLRQGVGHQFSPVAVDATLKLMGGTPLASVLKLDNGQLGLVVDVGCGEPGRPVVRIIQDEFGNRPPRTVLLDLAARIPATGEYLVDVVEAVDPIIRNIPIGRYI